MARKRYGFMQGLEQTLVPSLDEALRSELLRLTMKPQTDLAMALSTEQLKQAKTANTLSTQNVARGGEDFLTPTEAAAYEKTYSLTPGSLSGIRRQIVGDLLERTYTDPTTQKTFKLGPGGKLAPARAGQVENPSARLNELEGRYLGVPGKINEATSTPQAVQDKEEINILRKKLGKKPIKWEVSGSSTTAASVASDFGFGK